MICKCTKKEIIPPCAARGCPYYGDCLTEYESKSEKPTNADRFNAMSDDEKAEFIFLSPEMEFEICRYCVNGNPTPTDDRGQCLRDGGHCYANDACDAFKKWLRQESEEGKRKSKTPKYGHLELLRDSLYSRYT